VSNKRYYTSACAVKVNATNLQIYSSFLLKFKNTCLSIAVMNFNFIRFTIKEYWPQTSFDMTIITSCKIFMVHTLLATCN